MIPLKRLGQLLAIAAAALWACFSCAPIGETPSSPGQNPPAGSQPGGWSSTPIATAPSGRNNLQTRIEAAIENVRNREMLTTHAFWTVFHGLLGLGHSLELHDPESGRTVNALDYIASGGEVRGMRFLQTKDGLDVQIGPQYVGQGHQDQFIAEMIQWDIDPHRRFVVNGNNYTFMDFVNCSKMRASVKASQELSWAIIVIGDNYGLDAKWTNGAGEQVTLEDCIRYELNQSVEQAACGGTHRLFGLTWVLHRHLAHGGAKTGLWKDIAEKELKYQNLARKYQNPDGSLSTNFFRGPANASDQQAQIYATGHTVEWLAFSLPDEELTAPWMQEAVNRLALMFMDIQDKPMEGGALYHATHGLLIYYARVFDPKKLGANEPYVPLADGKCLGKRR
jgi:hypothetical protein